VQWRQSVHLGCSRVIFEAGGQVALNLEDKKALVAEVSAIASRAQSAVAAEYRGLSVSQLTELRSKARAAGTSFECLGPVLKGPLVLGFSQEDPGAAARVFRAFSKDNEKLVPTAVSLSGKLLGAKDLERVANLPTREQALSMLLGVMRAPIQKLVGTLAAAPSKLVRTLAAVRDQKQAAAA
jgi:large subunit ribosomal protein L10